MDVRLQYQVKVSTAFSGYNGAFQFDNVLLQPGSTVTVTVNVYINGTGYVGTGTYTVPDYCSCDATPNVLALQDVCKAGCTEPACAGVPTSFDLTPYKDTAFLGDGHLRSWRVIETGYGVTYGYGNVAYDGTLIGLPDSIPGNECYPGHLQLQIGCQHDGVITWP